MTCSVAPGSGSLHADGQLSALSGLVILEEHVQMPLLMWAWIPCGPLPCNEISLH